MDKKIYFFIFSIICILFLSGCDRTFYGEYKDAPLLEKENVYVEISLEEFYTKLDSKETFLVYYGQKECTTCYISVGFLSNYAKESGIDTIYYLKAKILDFGGDDDRVDQMQAKIGFDEKNSPYAAPRLWFFKEGQYINGMGNFVLEGETTWMQASKRFYTYYLEQVEKQGD